MEVHHHPHLTHKEKPWKEYLLEGLMIFIAVTMGFFAESIHETIREANLKKELLEVVKSDFEKDIKQLELQEKYAHEKMQKCDSLIKYLNANPATVDQFKFYDCLITIKGWWFFNSVDKSRIQAEAKGYFNTKGSDELADAIIKFNFFKNDYTNMEQNEVKQIELFNAEIPHISDYESFKLNNRFPLSINPKNKIGISRFDKESVKKVQYIVSEIMFNNDVYLSDINFMKESAKKAIEQINKQYH
jgi:hypothetical protein